MSNASKSFLNVESLISSLAEDAQQLKLVGDPSYKIYQDIIFRIEGLDSVGKLGFKFGCGFATCVTPGDGYDVGKTYPILGDNNGIHICRREQNGDVHDGIFQTGGIGDGLFNPFDDSGAPSFDEAFIWGDEGRQ